MENYYFVICALPTLKIQDKPDLTFDGLMDFLMVNLDEEDKKSVRDLRMYSDFLNLRFFWEKKTLDPRGNLSEKQIEEALLVEDFFPEFVFDFINQNQDVSSRLKHFPFLISQFFKEQMNGKTGFLKKFFRFEWELRLILTALRSFKLKRDILFELQYEDPTDFFVAYILAQKDMDSFTPPMEYEKVKQIFEKKNQEPQEIYEALLEYRFNKIQELSLDRDFKIDHILSYMAQLILVENYTGLSQEKGEAIIQSLM